MLEQISKYKITISLVLILCFITPFVGTYSWLTYKKTLIKKEVKKQLIMGIEKDNLVKLGFRLDEVNSKVRWEHSKEFEFQGQMFDIVTKEVVADSIYYLCWPDHEETVLNNKLYKLASDNFSNDKESKDRQKRLSDFSFNLFPPASSENQFSPINTQYLSMLYNINYLSIYTKPKSPPPRFA